MIRLLKLWYQSKKLKYSTYLLTYEELTEKFLENMDELTLIELLQYRYMVKEQLGLSALAVMGGSTEGTTENPPTEPAEARRGQYL